MRLFCTVRGEPAIIVGYAPGKPGPLAICLVGSVDHPIDVPLADCILPKLPKKLQRKVRHFIKAETRQARMDLAEGHQAH